MKEEQIRSMIAEAFEKKGHLMTATEVAEAADISRQKAQGFVVSYRRTLTQLFVQPNGFIRTSDGDVVWLRNSRGSMVLARHKEDAKEGHVISG